MALGKQKGLCRASLTKSRRGETGQVLLIVVLIVVITLTIGLSAVSRSITSFRSSTEEKESQKALSAAEAGIERVLQSNIPVNIAGNLINDSNYSTNIKEIKNSSFLINGGNTIPKNEGVDIWLVDRNPDGTPNYSTPLSPQFFNIYWGEASETPCSSAAIQVIAVTRDPLLADASPDKVKSYRYAYDSCPARGSENNFTEASSGIFQKDYDGDGNIDMTFINVTPETGSNSNLLKNVTNVVFMRVIPLYKDTKIGVNACNHGGNNCTNLPLQGYEITSTGKSGSSNRKISAFKGYQQIYLPYLSFGLFVAR